MTTHRFSEYEFYAQFGLEQITSNGEVPSLGKRSEKFAGFGGGEVYRPLVAVSAPNFSDPEVWKPAKLSPHVIAALRQQFRPKFGNVKNCKNPKENILRPWHYLDADILIGKAYSSQTNWTVAEMNLPRWNCDGAADDGGPFDGQWYVLQPGGAIRFLDTGMWLVDAGDYDKNGKSELIFAIGRYDLGGYEIFYDGFKKKATFTFIYD